MNGSDQREVWQRLFALESHDLVQARFEQIHARQLNARRAGEINAAARQAREYFLNAAVSDYSVRPLLSFYGVASLTRALLLLMKRTGGEECLTAGHGLETVGWRNLMSGDTAAGLKRLGDLSARRRQGLFSDFLAHAGNRTLVYQKSAAVSDHWEYDQPNIRTEISLGDLFSRIPDLWADHVSVADSQFANVIEYSYVAEQGLKVKLGGDRAAAVAHAYANLGYTVADGGKHCTITCETEAADNEPPLFVHTFLHKMTGAIPWLRLAVPFGVGARLSELGMAYVVSYMLGMLVRYFPTHWMALINGGKGDRLWPTINPAQQYVESVFPELVAEYVRFAIRDAQK